MKELKKISGSEGDIFKFIDKECDEFDGFGEIYFSTVKKNNIKGWNSHKESSCKIVVVNGEIEFILSKNLTDFNSYKKFLLSEDSLNLLSIPKNTWFAFRGLGKKNILINLASLKHDPSETLKRVIENEHRRFITGR